MIIELVSFGNNRSYDYFKNYIIIKMSFNILKDEELDRIKHKKLHEMIQKQNEMQEQEQIKVMELNSENVNKNISENSLT